MAQKKKTTKKKSAKAVEATPVAAAERSPFWSYGAAVLLMLVAIFLLLGGFGTGGSLPKGLFGGAYWLFGWGAWLTPLALVYWGIYKFQSEDHRVPLAKLFGMLAVLVFSAGFLHTAFATVDAASGNHVGGHGGNIGSGLGGAILTALDKMPASLLLFVLTIFSVFFAFAISPKVLLKLGDIFKTQQREGDTDLIDLKRRRPDTGFNVKKAYRSNTTLRPR